MLVNNNRNFVKDRDTRHELRLLGNRLIASEGGFWRRQRRLMQPAFHRERVNAFGRVIVAYAERMLEGWADGQPRDVHEDLPRLRYAGMVVKESMRLYPPVWAIGREALDYCEIGGYGVSAGAQLFMSQWVVHRDGRHFENPEAFDPDRWANGLEKSLPKYAYFPFGGGPRLCIGDSFATMEATLLLATVARRFRLEVLPDHPVEPQPSITLRPKGGLPAVPRARR